MDTVIEQVLSSNDNPAQTTHQTPTDDWRIAEALAELTRVERKLSEMLADVRAASSRLTGQVSDQPTTELGRIERRIIRAIQRAPALADRHPEHAAILHNGRLTRTALRRVLGTVQSALIDAAVNKLTTDGTIRRDREYRLNKTAPYAVEVIWIPTREELEQEIEQDKYQADFATAQEQRMPFWQARSRQGEQ